MSGRTTRPATGLTDTAHIILARCAQGLYPVGSMLARAADLAVELRVPEVAVNSALSSMAGSGVLERTPTHRYRVAEQQLWRVHLPRPSLSARIAAEQIKREILDGWHPTGRGLPSLSAISSAMRMSADDVKRALRDLAAEGLIALPHPGRPALVLYEAPGDGASCTPHLAYPAPGARFEEPSCPERGR
ncbi:GntR family transcriptional regulator [Streptomyces sp. NPDC048272]|uniref:GntR family transcriptional regulator n=1 Tax=Streptomyces sp. NPDC048272 TaxID=3154616 RepID=UPI003419FF31